MVLNPMTMGKVPYDPVKDFTPMGILAVSTTSIVVHASVAGAGIMSNLSGELFKQLPA